MAAARARGFYDEQARERRTATLKQNQPTDVANLPQRIINTCKSRDAAGKAFGVSGSLIRFRLSLGTDAGQIDKLSETRNQALFVSA